MNWRMRLPSTDRSTIENVTGDQRTGMRGETVGGFFLGPASEFAGVGDAFGDDLVRGEPSVAGERIGSSRPGTFGHLSSPFGGTIEEAARVLRIGRGQAYELAFVAGEWRCGRAAERRDRRQNETGSEDGDPGFLQPSPKAS